MPLEIRVLGPLEVLVDRAPLHVDTRKALAILALLAVEGRPYARDELAAIFWPESDDESARGALRRTLSVLRSAVGDRWLVIDRSSVALPPADDVSLDLQCLEAASTISSPDDLARIAALARGPFLAGFSLRDSPDFDDWRATRAVSVERRVIGVLERLADAAQSAGDTMLAAETAARLVELDPLDEPARRRLMGVLARSGDRAGAIRVYRSTVAVLERELGVPPLAETTELYEAIRDDRYPGPGPAGLPEPEPTGAPATSAVPPGDRPARLPMLGRRAELARLVEAHRASSGDGRVAAIAGEAGIGKSRLAEAAGAEAAAAGATVLVARAFPAEGSIAYAPVIDLLRSALAGPEAAARLAGVAPAVLAEVSRLVPLPAGIEVGRAPVAQVDSPAARARLLEAVADALAAAVGGPVPGVVTVEDVHWADGATREALLFIARRLAGRSLLLVLTWRPEDLDPDGQSFAAAVTSLPGAVTVHLGRLDDVVVGALAEAARAAGLAAWDPMVLAAESEGLPLYVAEALMAGPGVDPGTPPRGVQALLRERLGHVSESSTQVLAAAAVVGRSFEFGVARVASGRSEDETLTALDDLVRRGIVREVERGGEPRFDFAHASLREAAYQGIGLARRRILHRRVAEALRATAPDDVATLALIAGHEQAAGRDAAAAEAYRDAGLRARAVFANREAVEHLEAALALGHPDPVGLQTAIGEIRTATGDYQGARVALESAASLADAGALPGIELRLGRVHARRGDAAAASSHLDVALATLTDPRQRTAAMVERGAVALRAGDLDLASTLAGEADELASTRGDRPVQGAAARLLGLVAHRRGALEAAHTALARSVALAAETAADDPEPLIAARNALALVEADAGHPEAAIELLSDALADCRRAGEPHLEAAVENNLADQLHASGRTEEAMDHLKRAVALFAEVGGSPDELEPGIWRLVTW